MKKQLLFVPILILLIGLSGCSSERSRGNLPQSTRPKQSAIIAAATAGLGASAGSGTVDSEAVDSEATAPATGAATADTPERLTFFEREDGAIVFHLGNQTDYSHPLHLGLLRFKEEVETRSEGSLIVEVYSNSRIGGDGVLMNMVNDNQLDAAIITIWGLWHNLTDYANLESLPFLFSNYDEAWAAYEGTLGAWVAENVIEPHGARVLGFWTNGLRHFTNSVRPIHTPADMIGLRMRSPQIATNLAMYEEFGSASVSMAFDLLYDNLASGMIDGQDNPLGNIHTSRLFEVQRYLSLSSHMFSSAPLIVSTDFWYSLSEEHRQILLDSSAIAARHQGDLTRAMEVNQLGDMIAFGTQVNQVDMAAFMTAVEPIWEDHIERFGSDFITIARNYISDPSALAHRFGG